MAATPDIDGDGKADILWHNQSTGDVYAYFMNGTAFVAAAYVMTVQPVWRLAGTPDVTGEGKPDILWHNQSTGDVYVHFMSGVTSVGAAYLFTVDPVWKAITARAPVKGTPVPDFTVAATPGTQTVTQGNSTNYTVTIGATDGFAGAVGLGASGLPASATASFAPSSVTASGTVTMTVTTAANTPTGSSTLTITGTSGSLTHNTIVSLTVTAATFSLSGVISPPGGGASATVNLGGASTATVAADSSGNYVFNGLANGLYTVTPGKAGFTFTPSSRNVTVNGGNVTGVDFTATPITISITSPGQGATVSNAFSITASASAGVVGVQFRVDGQNVGPEDTSAPFSTSVTAPAGSHALTAVARDASGNTVTSGMVNVTVSSAGGTALTVNGAQTFQWVEMMTTLFFYARNTENVQFDMIDPLNEPDWDGLEGPRVDSGQYTRLLEKLSVKLDAMGLSALRFVGPNTAQIGTGVNDYMPEMMSSAVVMSKVDHFAFHNYAGDSGGADAAIKGSPYASRNFWITEVSNAWDVMSHIGQNPSATLVWDAYDSVYNHAILAGRGTTPPNDVGNGPPLLQYNTATGTYTPRSAFYEHAQIFKFVPRGSVRIGATESNANLQMYAFRHQASGRVTIVGRNSGGSTISVNGALSGLPAVGTLQFYQTSGGDFFQRGSDAVVTGGAFVFSAPANSFFTLTSP